MFAFQHRLHHAGQAVSCMCRLIHQTVKSNPRLRRLTQSERLLIWQLDYYLVERDAGPALLN